LNSASILRRFIHLALGLSAALLAACTTLPPSGVPAQAGSPPGEATQAQHPLPAEASPAPEVSTPQEKPLAGERPKELERGLASWYGPRFHGRRTASGERYDMQAFTAAHKTLPFGTMVRVKNLASGQEVDVSITDRGPFRRGRVIDLSRAAADALGMVGDGVADVLLLVPESFPVVVPVPKASKRVRAAPRPAKRKLQPE
jgi:rare lipoprotein A